MTSVGYVDAGQALAEVLMPSRRCPHSTNVIGIRCLLIADDHVISATNAACAVIPYCRYRGAKSSAERVLTNSRYAPRFPTVLGSEMRLWPSK